MKNFNMKNKMIINFYFIIFGTFLFQNDSLAASAPTTCSAAKLTEILSAATTAKPNVNINCNLKLKPTDVVTKYLIFEGEASSNITLDCNSALLKNVPVNSWVDRIIVTSRPINNHGIITWEPARNIIIKNCNVDGSIRVRGMAVNGEDINLKASSRLPGHTARVRFNAPYNIVLLHNKVIGIGRSPIYFAPGVHHSSIISSYISGKSNGSAIYLDAESGFNLIRDNVITVETKVKDSYLWGWIEIGREQISIDGSSNNKIINNYFTRLNHGGIYLYRNCGEGGNIRHQTPSYNQISNNIFYYNKYLGFLPSVWIASRNGRSDYCNLDKGYNLGSSINNNDLAKYNYVFQNQIYKLSPYFMIRSNESPNWIFNNSSVNTSVKRRSNCYMWNGSPSVYLIDGQANHRITLNGKPFCDGNIYTCNNGELIKTPRACK